MYIHNIKSKDIVHTNTTKCYYHRRNGLYLNIVNKQSAAAFLQILLCGGQGEEIAPNSSDRSLSLNKHSTGDGCRQRWERMDTSSLWSIIRCPWRVQGSGLASGSSVAVHVVEYTLGPAPPDIHTVHVVGTHHFIESCVAIHVGIGIF